jgi:nucleotide-binding universal stress UspA family protein
MKKILVAIDGSVHALKAVEMAAELASKHRITDVTLINIIPIIPTETGPFPTAALPEDVEAWEIFKQPKEILRKVGVNPLLLLEEGDPASGIVEAARNGNFDLVVVGHRGLSSIEAFLLGSVSNRVVTHAPCSVLVVR